MMHSIDAKDPQQQVTEYNLIQYLIDMEHSPVI